MTSYPRPGKSVPGFELPPLRERRITLGHLPLRILCPESPAELIERSLDEYVQQEPGAADATAADALPDVVPPYWADIWPAAVALGRRILTLPLAGKRVLEIGAGVGLAGLAAARAGAQVLLTDREPIAVEIARRNAALNDLTVATRVLDWDQPAPPEAFDLIIGADIIYEKQQVAPVVDLLASLLARGGQALIADPNRSNQQLFLQMLIDRGLPATPTPTHFYWDRMARTVTLIEVKPGK